jgi:putative peptidoglycan lipid II flippase
MPDDTRISSHPRSSTGARPERTLLVSRAGVVAAGTLASRVLGLVRDAAIAALFDRSQTDAFWVAFTMPTALRQLLAEGAVSSAVLPVLSRERERAGEDAARAFFARIRAVFFVVTCAVAVLGVVAAGPLTEAFAGGFHDVPGKFEHTRALTRLVFPYVVLMGAAAMGMAALNAARRFAVAAIAPAALNVGIVAAAFALRRPLAAHGVDPTLALGVGVLLGGGLQVAIQLPSLRALGYLGRPVFDLRDPQVREVGRRILPTTFGLGVYYIDLVVSRRLLSGLGDGAQSYFSWAMRICDLPQGIFVMALSTAALPSLATLAARGERAELGRTFSHAMRLALTIAVPASFALVALAEPIVVLLFRRGAFDAEAARETARALAWQGSAVFLIAAARHLVTTLYALGDTRSPVLVSVADSVVFVGVSLGLRGPCGHVAVSIAVAASTLVQVILLAAALRHRLGSASIQLGSIGVAFAKVAVAASAAAVLARATSAALGSSAVSSIAALAVFAVVYLVTAAALHRGEARAFYAAFAARRTAREVLRRRSWPSN